MVYLADVPSPDGFSTSTNIYISDIQKPQWVRADQNQIQLPEFRKATTGVVQGGFLAAMLDDTMGPALVATLEPDQFAPTLELKVNFLRPARPGRLVGIGRVVHRGGTIAFLAGELQDSDGRVLATATATARIVRLGGAD